MAIGGDGALRAQILVDGATRGYAPRALMIPIGAHELVLVRPDGTRVRRSVLVESAHTQSAPLRWVVNE